MIKLDIKDYCENCPDFRPEVDKETVYMENFEDPLEPARICETIITCEYAKRCECIYKKARKQAEKDFKEKNNG